MAGAIAGRPSRIAENAACANTPAPRIVQRYLGSRARVEVTQLLDLFRVRSLAVLAGRLRHNGQVLELGMSEERSQSFAHQPFEDIVEHGRIGDVNARDVEMTRVEADAEARIAA